MNEQLRLCELRLRRNQQFEHNDNATYTTIITLSRCCLLIVCLLWLDAMRKHLLSDWTTVFTSSCSPIRHHFSALPAFCSATSVQLFLLSDQPPVFSSSFSHWPTVFQLRLVLSSAVVVVVQAENKKKTRASDWVCVSSPPVTSPPTPSFALPPPLLAAAAPWLGDAP